MITIKIKGGLGNQMFQYATARALSLFNDTSMILDISSYNNPRRKYPYPFVLDKFNIANNRGKSKDARLIKERIFAWDIDLIQKFGNENVILDGYWQAEEYFKQYRNVILKEFILKEEYITTQLLAMEERITGNKEPIFMHIRRNEIVVDVAARKAHEKKKKNYYIRALSMMNKWFPDSLIVGVSDDYQWMKNEFGEVIDVTLEKFTDYETIYLMSKCKHSIIANSSFSWWGSWLINNPNKIIIVPNQWTIDRNNSNINIIPFEWIKLNCNYE